MLSRKTVAKRGLVETAAWISSMLTVDRQVKSEKVASWNFKGISRVAGSKGNSSTIVLPVQALTPVIWMVPL